MIYRHESHTHTLTNVVTTLQHTEKALLRRWCMFTKSKGTYTSRAASVSKPLKNPVYISPESSVIFTSHYYCTFIMPIQYLDLHLKHTRAHTHFCTKQKHTRARTNEHTANARLTKTKFFVYTRVQIVSLKEQLQALGKRRRNSEDQYRHFAINQAGIDEESAAAMITRARSTPQKNSRLQRIYNDHNAWLRKKEEIESFTS